MTWRKWLIAGAVCAPLLALLAWGLKTADARGTASAEAAFLVNFIVLVANVVMAAAAIMAVTLWRKQIAGESQHEIAKRVAMVLQDIKWRVSDTLTNWHNWRNGQQQDLPRVAASVAEFQPVIAEVRKATIEVRAVWGEFTAGPLQSLGDQCGILSSMVMTELSGEYPQLRESTTKMYDGAKPDGAWHNNVKAQIKLIDEWAASYLGRAGAKAMDDDEYDERYVRLIFARSDPEYVEEILEEHRLARPMLKRGVSREKVDKALERLRTKRKAKKAAEARKKEKTPQAAGSAPPPKVEPAPLEPKEETAAASSPEQPPASTVNGGLKT